MQVVAAQGGQFTSVYVSRVVYQLHDWTHARNGCSSGEAWPPLWSCLYAFPSAEQVCTAQALNQSLFHLWKLPVCIPSS
jgi:hypothetical protein